MKRQIFALTLLSLVLALTFSPPVQSNISSLRFPQRGSSIAVIAYCYALDSEISVSVAINSSSGGFQTPYAFNFLDETYSITVPIVDRCGHSFVGWNTGEKNSSITVSSAGVYIACYGEYPSLLPYNAVINTSFNGDGILNVNVSKDGTLAVFNAPCTFTRLTGSHTFTVPYVDSNGYRFKYWIGPSDTLTYSTTIIVSSGGTYMACYDIGLCQYVTPSDPTIVEAAKNKSWIEMLDYVSSKVSFGNNTNWQMPQETLALGSGQCRDYATLYVSMLRCRGYEAYVTVGIKNESGTEKSHAWVVFNFNGDFLHVEPQWAAYKQKFVNFTLYEPEFNFDENRVIASIASSDPPLLTDQGDYSIVFSVLLLAIVFVTAMSLSIVCWRAKKGKSCDF